MSGRDLRNFITNHRTADSGTGEVERMKDGLYSSKYKQVDYDKLRALASVKKFAGQEKLVKVKKLQQVSRHGREQNMLKQHHLVWHREFSRLASVRSQLQADVDAHVLQSGASEELHEVYGELEAYAAKLERDLEKFRHGTATPVWNLREDVKLWAGACQTQTLTSDMEQDPEQVKVTVAKVRGQQAAVVERLELEQQELEAHLHTGDLPMLPPFPHVRRVQTGIPEEAFDLQCADLDLKASILQEFILIDHRYMERLHELELQHTTATSSPTGGWTEEEHFVFTYVVDQYTHDIQNRRALYIDRLRRHLPHMSRNDIVAHEEWWLMYRFYHERRRDLHVDWSRDRAEMMNRSRVTFAEFTAAQEEDRRRKEDQRHQQRLCDSLCAKVREWREEKLEVLCLQQQQHEERRQRQLEQMRSQEQQERIRRERDREKLEEYYTEQTAEQQRRDEGARVRLAELQARHTEQALYHRDRVHFREVETHKKEEERKQQQRDQELAQAEREMVLEKIREKVRPHVEGDLMRLWADTESWNQRVRGQDEFINIQKPLYEINTFTSKQVHADPRFRLAERLHEAGLTKNTYAQQVFSKVQPAQPPRRDMVSTVFKHLS